MRYEKTVDGVHGQHLPLTYGATDGGEAGARRWTVATPDSHYGNAAGYARVRDLCWAGGRGLIRSLGELSHWHRAKRQPAATPVPLKLRSGLAVV